MSLRRRLLAAIPARDRSAHRRSIDRTRAVPAGPIDDGATALGVERARLLCLAAAAGVVTMAVTSTGDLLVVGVLLGLVAADAVVGAVGVVAGMATLGRWSSSSLTALAGGQAVLGAAGWTGSVVLALSSWAAAAGVILVSPEGRPAALAFGLVAAGLVAGPALGDGSGSDLVVRIVASAIGVAGAWAASRAVPRRLAKVGGLGLAVFALFLAIAPATTTG